MDKEPPENDNFWLGLLLAFTLNLLAMFLACGTLGAGPGVGGMFLLAIGATQLIYLGPIMIYLGWKRRFNMLMGVAVIAGVTMLLNTTCVALVGRHVP